MNKVVLLAPTPPPVGGIAGWTMRMLEANLKNGWRVEVVDEKLLGNTETFGEGSKRHLSDEIKRTYRIWSNLCTKLKDKDVRVVHSCIPSTTFAMIREYICAVITHRKKRKFIMHFRCTTPNTTQGEVGYFVFKKLCKISDHIIVLNTSSLDHVKSVCNTSVEIIPNFVDVSEINKNKVIEKELKVALYVGGVIETKGCSIICDIAKYFPKIQFRMVGKAEQSIINKASLLPNVVLTGPKNKNEVKEELRRADVFLFFSHFRGEGFSNSLAEAMAYGIPCIATDWAANADMIENKGGIVVGVDNVEDALKAISAELNYELRKSQSMFNLNKVLNSYTSDIVLDMYVDCYERLN